MAASVAVWYQHQLTRRALDFWGARLAQRIEQGSIVELFALKDGTADAALASRSPIDLSHVPGVLHFRRSLLQDANFDWDAQNQPAVSDRDWDFAVRFSDDEGSILVLFDLDRGVVANRSKPDSFARVSEKTSRGLRKFFEENLAH
jgi:hypothetical protein